MATMSAAPATLLLRNRTAHRVRIGWTGAAARGALEIPAYGTRAVGEDEAAALDLEPWLARGIVTTGSTVERSSLLRPVAEGALGAAVGFGVWALLIWLAWELLAGAPDGYWTVALSAIGAVAVLMILSQVHARGGARALRALAVRSLRPLSWGRAFAGDVALAVAVAVVAVGVPSAVILATGGWAAPPAAPPAAVAGAAAVSVVGPVEAATGWVRYQLAADPVHLTGRALQLVLIALLASLPAALYFLFDRRKLGVLRERFFRSVLALDPDLRTLDDVQSVYGARVDEVLGARSEGRRRPPVGVMRQVMVPLTTLALALGWTLALDPSVVAASVGGEGLMAYVVPGRTPLAFAFVGGYLFAIGMLLRRYVRSDLKPETLAHVLVRILGAVLLAWALDATLGAATTPSVVLLIAFTVGVFPESGMSWLTDVGRSAMAALGSKMGGAAAVPGPSLRERFPLDCLDGMNMYHRSRLMDEGVDNLENLAHADIVDLVLETRIHVGTLVDWVDQAILVLHTHSAAGGGAHYEVLRDHGIRTATDLEKAWLDARSRAAGDAFLRILGSTGGGPPRLRVLLDALEDDQWMAQLRQARESGRGRMPLSEDVLPVWDEGEDRLAELLRDARKQARRRRTGEAVERIDGPAVSEGPTMPSGLEGPAVELAGGSLLELAEADDAPGADEAPPPD